MTAALKHRNIDYPTGDGKPMAETDVHRDVMLDSIAVLKQYKPRWYVSGNLLVYYEEGNPRRHVAPDVFVVRGISRRKRLLYKLWEERKGPDWVLEITSKSTSNEDLDTKFELYRDHFRVPEYFLFDPLDEYLSPRLLGYRLTDADYEPIALIDGRVPSHVLGLHLEAQGSQLRFFDPKASRWLPTTAETAAALDATSDTLAATTAALAEAQARIKKLEAELRQSRTEKG